MPVTFQIMTFPVDGGGATWCGKYSVCFAFLTLHIVWMVVPISI